MLPPPDSHAIGQPRYTDVAILLHWVIALAVIANICFALLTEDLPKPDRAEYMAWHKALGITILALTVLRLLWRLMHRPPPLPKSDPAWMNGLAHLVHGLFYVLLIALPLVVWIGVSGGGKPVSWFGLFDIPALPIGGGKATSEAAFGAHEVMGFSMIALIVLHVGAALKHQFIDRDNLLARMRPVA